MSGARETAGRSRCRLRQASLFLLRNWLASHGAGGEIFVSYIVQSNSSGSCRFSICSGTERGRRHEQLRRRVHRRAAGANEDQAQQKYEGSLWRRIPGVHFHGRLNTQPWFFSNRNLFLLICFSTYFVEIETSFFWFVFQHLDVTEDFQLLS